MSTIFDSHSHPQMRQYDPVKLPDGSHGASNDREEMLKRAKDAGVSIICVGTDLKTSKQGIELAQRYKGIWATVGIHPNDAPESIKGQVLSIKEYEDLLKEERIVAIGEIGLDYYRTPESYKQEEQKAVFSQFLDLAIKYNKPVVIHSRDAAKGSTGKVHQDVLSILNTKYLIHHTNLHGVAHSFTGNIEQAEQYIKNGFYLGFNGIITFPSSRKAMKDTVPGMYDEVVKYAPLDRILLETDAPFLAPEPYRGKRNEPAYVIEVAKKVAELKDESLEKVIKQTTENCRKLFNLI